MAQEIVPWVIGANALLSMAALLYSWFASGSTKVQKQVDLLAEEVEELKEGWTESADKRSDSIRKEVREGFQELKEAVALTSSRNNIAEKSIAVIESRLEHMPSREMTHRLELGLTALSGQVETLSERIKPVAAVATRLQEHAMEETRR
jgi:ElaB/YqjD/DUF883 family membrane-anchored ribosome-binding protein